MLALSRIAEGYDEAQKAFAEAGAIPSLIQVMVIFRNETNDLGLFQKKGYVRR